MIPVLVVGSTFGAVHAHAIACDDELTLSGIMGAGSARTTALADAYHVPVYRDLATLPKPQPNQVASVVLRSTALGGNGVQVAADLLSSGWNVLLEQPVRGDEITELARIAAKQRTNFRIGNLYLNLSAIKQAITVVDRLRSKAVIKSVRVMCATQTIYPAVAVARRLAGPGAATIEATVSKAGFATCVGGCGNVNLSIHVHNEHDVNNRDDGGLGLVSAEIITSVGTLVVSDAAGPVNWYPRVAMNDLDELGLPRLDEQTPRGITLAPAADLGLAQWIRRDWTQAIAEDIKLCSSTGFDKDHIVAVLADAQWWTMFSRAIGLPETVSNEEQASDAEVAAMLGIN